MAGRSGIDFYSDQRVDGLTDEAVRRTTSSLDAIPAPAGSLPIVLAAGSFFSMKPSVMEWRLISTRKNISVYSEKPNKQIAPSEVTIVDDGTQLGARGSINIDDEGNYGQRTTLVENGVLRTYA